MDSTPCSEKGTYFWGFYTDINKLEMSVYKIGDISKIVQSPFDSVQKSELFAILMVLFDFNEPLNIITNS